MLLALIDLLNYLCIYGLLTFCGLFKSESYFECYWENIEPISSSSELNRMEDKVLYRMEDKAL